MALGGVILGAAYFLGFFQRAFLGPLASPELAFAWICGRAELLVAGVLGLLVLIGGLFPSGCRSHGRCQQRLGGADGGRTIGRRFCSHGGL